MTRGMGMFLLSVKINNSTNRAVLKFISNTRYNVSSRYSNTEKRVEKTTCNGVFFTKFEVFG